MTFDDILAQVLAQLQCQGRMSYRALKRRFGLDDGWQDNPTASAWRLSSFECIRSCLLSVYATAGVAEQRTTIFNKAKQDRIEIYETN
jgi:hypothetical protein